MKSGRFALFCFLGVASLCNAFAPSYRAVHFAARSRYQRSMPSIRPMVSSGDNLSDETDPTTDSNAESSQPKGNIIARLGRMMSKTKDGKLFDRKTLAKMGTNVLLAYGFVSNAFGCVSVSCAWYISSKRSGLSPLAPEQWKTFTAAYAGFYILLNILRPARFALSIAISPFWERTIQQVQNRFKVSKPLAFGLVVFVFNFCGSIVMMAGGVLAASALSGVPIWAGR